MVAGAIRIGALSERNDFRDVSEDQNEKRTAGRIILSRIFHVRVRKSASQCVQVKRNGKGRELRHFGIDTDAAECDAVRASRPDCVKVNLFIRDPSEDEFRATRPLGSPGGANWHALRWRLQRVAQG